MCVCVCCIFNGVVRRPSQRGGLPRGLPKPWAGARGGTGGDDGKATVLITAQLSPSQLILPPAHTLSVCLHLPRRVTADTILPSQHTDATNRFLKRRALDSVDRDSIRQHVSYGCTDRILRSDIGPDFDKIAGKMNRSTDRSRSVTAHPASFVSSTCVALLQHAASQRVGWAEIFHARHAN